MKSKDLFSHLSNLEAQLSSFSFEELTAKEASKLKKSFQSFKNSLDEKVLEKSIPNNQKKVVKVKQTSEEMLIANVSHEIRTPLNGIIGFTDLLLESKLSKNQLEHVNAIQSASSNLLDIINELLEYSKLSSGLEHFEFTDFNFYSIIRDVMFLCNTLILDKDVKLEVDMDTNIPEVLIGDPSKLSQILLNLIGNAIKFVEKGDIHLRIALKEEKEGNVLLEFDVVDTGIGISEENLKHIFKTFNQGEQNTYIKYGGSGLGLSIVKQIVETLKGEISASSTLGVGTTFKFILPYKKGSKANLVKIENPPKDLNQKLDVVKNMNILIFEDNPLNQRLIEQRLKVWGCKTYVSESGVHGLNILENNKIDLVLMDLRMPDMDGFQVTQKIRNNKNIYIRKIPIIALTADFSIKDKEQCQKYGINDYVLKPYSPDELLLKLTKNKKDMEIHIVESKKINPENMVGSPTDINLDEILEECLGEVDLLQELVGLYKQNVLEFIGNIKVELKTKNFKALEFASHKIKPGLAMMKTFSLHAIAEEMHGVCKTNKDLKYMEFLYNCFLDEYPVVEKAIDNEVKRLRN